MPSADQGKRGVVDEASLWRTAPADLKPFIRRHEGGYGFNFNIPNPKQGVA